MAQEKKVSADARGTKKIAGGGREGLSKNIKTFKATVTCKTTSEKKLS